MKTIAMLLFTILLNACGGAKEATANATNTNEQLEKSEMVTKKTQEPEKVIIEYSAITRGSFYVLKINGKKVSTQNSPNEKPTFKAVGEDNWKALMQMVDDIDLKAMEKMKAPSEKRFYDGAAIGELKITKDGETYQVPNFDAGNPNEGVSDLINKMLAIAKDKE